MSEEWTPTEHRKPDSVRAFKRGLDVLQEVNRSGGIRAGDLARRLNLPRPTVYRLLETLEELGYVARSSSDERFRVTRRASSLGDGCDPAVLIGQTAAPAISELGKRLIWPVDLSTYENAAMIIQESTHARSPVSIDRGMLGRRLPMLRTSAGRAYLTACIPAERNIILNHLRRIDDVEDKMFLQESYIERLLEQTASQGFAVRSDGEFNAKTSSIAVPIVQGDIVMGCISIIWIRSALSLDEAISSFAAPMKEVAAYISSSTP